MVELRLIVFFFEDLGLFSFNDSFCLCSGMCECLSLVITLAHLNKSAVQILTSKHLALTFAYHKFVCQCSSAKLTVTDSSESASSSLSDHSTPIIDPWALLAPWAATNLWPTKLTSCATLTEVKVPVVLCQTTTQRS